VVIQPGRSVPDTTAGCVSKIEAGTEDTALLFVWKQARARCGRPRPVSAGMGPRPIAATEGPRYGTDGVREVAPGGSLAKQVLLFGTLHFLCARLCLGQLQTAHYHRRHALGRGTHED
jgi:hypothetical protein